MDNQGCALELAKCNLHSFKQKKKDIVNTGSCRLIKQPEQIKLKVQATSLYFGCKSTLVKLVESQYVNYLTSGNNSNIYSISFPSTDIKVNEFEEILKSYKVTIIQFNSPSLNEKIKQQIQANCPVGQNSIGNPDIGKQIGQSIGVVFGSISGALNLNTVNTSYRSSLNNFSDQTFSRDTKSKWSSFKDSLKGINDKMTQTMEPVSKVVKQKTTLFGNMWRSSDNSIVKGVRQFSGKATESINEGYMKGENPIVLKKSPQNSEPQEMKEATKNGQ